MKASQDGIPLCGILLIDKPAGPSSHDLVAQIRRLTGIRKVGHGGTLDPFATGLLIVLVGKATRLFDFLAPLEKAYKVEVQFGAISTTGDPTGEITAVAGRVSEKDLLDILPQFLGTVTQQPHRFSAVKVDGEALYLKARRGEEARAAPRLVDIREIELLSFDEITQRARLNVVCSKGTYIRTLCEDIASRVGTSAYATKLRRTAIGDFEVGSAATPEILAAMPAVVRLSPGNPSFISCMGALYFLPVREVDEKEARDVAAGRPLTGEEATPVRIGLDGRLIAVYGPAGEGTIRPLVVLI